MTYRYFFKLGKSSGLNGFTLAELLVSLIIIGMIATFTIPKVLQSQQDTRLKSIGKEAASMISGAFAEYRRQNTLTAATQPGDLTPYMNYVVVDSIRTVDGYQGVGPVACSPCLVLHNGATLRYNPTGFGDITSATSAMAFNLDPDGHTTTDGSGQAVVLWLYANGRITTYATVDANTYWGGAGPYNPCPACDPPWFSWS